MCGCTQGPGNTFYDLVEHGRFIHNPSTGRIGFITKADVDVPAPRTAVVRKVEETGRGIFEHWADPDLREAGFPDRQIAQLRACRVEDDLFDLDWSIEEFDLAVQLIGLTPDQWRNPQLVPDVNEGEARLRDAIDNFGALHGISRLFGPTEIERIAAAPIEDWMIFLHPDQRTVVERRYEGPARVRGPAGTGKTVVALHRAAELAHRFADADSGGRILFTTFIKSLPPVFENLYSRLPNAVDGAVEFVHIDRLAWSICGRAGVNLATDPRAIDAAFASARKKIVAPGSPLHTAGLTAPYLRDEVTAVIKGRGLTNIDDYLALDRVGRRTRFTSAMRRQTWELRNEWDAQMSARGTIDFPDVILKARDIALSSQPAYRAAIVDEAQDITLVGLQLVRALVAGRNPFRPDSLLIVGDGAQRIYAGGFTLKEAGIDVTGRATVLRKNYRNTAEIIGAALAVAGKEVVDDLGEEYRRGDVDISTARLSDFKPTLVSCAGIDDELRFLCQTIERLRSGGMVGLGDIGVFAATNDDATRTLDTFRKTGMPCLNLKDYDGSPSDEVKVGTYFRAKGLEFKVVFLPFLSDGRFPRRRQARMDDAQHAEQRELEVSQLYVAMTRARDALFVLCSGAPSEALGPAIDQFTIIES